MTNLLIRTVDPDAFDDALPTEGILRLKPSGF
jgi:hypothetical protein